MSTPTDHHMTAEAMLDSIEAMLDRLADLLRHDRPDQGDTAPAATGPSGAMRSAGTFARGPWVHFEKCRPVEKWNDFFPSTRCSATFNRNQADLQSRQSVLSQKRDKIAEEKMEMAKKRATTDHGFLEKIEPMELETLELMELETLEPMELLKIEPMELLELGDFDLLELPNDMEIENPGRTGKE